MSHESVRAEVQSIGKFLAHEILHDPSVSAAATTLVADVIRRESTKQAFLDLVLWTLERDATRSLVRDQLRAVVGDLCRDDFTQLRVSELLGAALGRDATRDAAINLGADLLVDGRTVDASSDLARRLLARDDVRQSLEDALVDARAGKECEIPNFKGSDLGRFPLVSADFWTSDHLSERYRSVDVFSGTRARGTLMLKRT